MLKDSVILVYFSRCGNTRKVAKSFYEELSVESFDIKKCSPGISNYQFLIIGSGTYGGKPSKELTEFLEALPEVENKKVFFFSTCSGDATKTIETMKQILNKKGYTIGDSFTCFGKFALLKRGHPNKEELNNAKDFAKQISIQIKNRN